MSAQNTGLRELLLGSGNAQLNLTAVRSRAEEMKRSLVQLIHGLQHQADRVQWAEALDRFAVINVQYQHLLDALRPMLRQFAAYPRSVNQSNAPVLPIMLATKLLPEMEAEEQQLLSMLEQEQRKLGAPPEEQQQQQQVLDLSIAERFAWVQDQEQELNHLVDQLVREESSPLGDRRRKEVQQVAAKAAAAAPLAAAERLPSTGGGGQQHGSAAPDPLLAAVAYGAGLI